MKLFDISQEVLSCEVYPGDPTPRMEAITRMKNGDLYNLSAFSMCAHNGTHVDAPFHFLSDGATVEQIPLEKTVGKAYVASCRGNMGENEAEALLAKIRAVDAEAAKRILIRGDAVIDESAARVFARQGVDLIGSESQSVGPQQAPMAVHRILLAAQVVLLEGIRLQAVADGVYWLCAAPLSLAGADGAPCRAILMELS
jgi:arylformamidase